MANAAPVRPQQDSQVLETLPPRAHDPLNLAIASLHAALAAHGHNFELAAELAKRHLERFRRDQDPRDLGQAEAAIEPWLRQANPPPRALVLRASVRQSNHFFASALDDLDHAIRAQPDNPDAWLIRANILQVQGRYPEAKQSCGQLILTNTVIAGICLANVAAVNGMAEQAYLILQRLAAQITSTDSLYPWLLISQAETAVWMGRQEDAERFFRNSLAANPRDAYLRAAWADFLLDQNRPKEVLALLAGDIRNDNLLLRLALAEKQAGLNADLARHVEDLGNRFTASAERGDRVHLREEAIYDLKLLNDPEKALSLAEADWQVQKEVADCRILMEAAIAARQPARAAPAMRWLKNARLRAPALTKLEAQLASLVPWVDLAMQSARSGSSA
ncbi:tetratricopeptide repeat protein [Paraburkholderia piptadeniae]|uniref:tetratricopeptide repeat protein n=1 Tax=Paraburkholderia piptadeniae TaxID=1701573 RepID=UPI000B4021A4|nr:tetratricopeptide repeat protein [Paraburkholderia piptadeniae]